MKNFYSIDREEREKGKRNNIGNTYREKFVKRTNSRVIFKWRSFWGQNSYGVTAASQTYFNKTLDELAQTKLPFLAALPKASDYHPVREKPFVYWTGVIMSSKKCFRMSTFLKISDEDELTRPIRSVQGRDYAGFRWNYPVETALRMK